VITDLIMAGKTRLENYNTYLYAIGHTGRLYKIQVNDANTANPNYNNPVLVTTLANSQTFLYGSSMEFYGSTQQIWIGHDTGATRINFDGTGETNYTASFTANVPRPAKQFNGKLYYGNSTNIAEFNDTTFVTGTKLSPALPISTQVRDLDVSGNGSYLVITSSEQQLVSILNTQPDTDVITNGSSLIGYWNGSDAGVTTAIFFPSLGLTSYQTFGSTEYSFGYDTFGLAIANPITKVLTLPANQSPLCNAVTSTANLIVWAAPYYVNDDSLSEGSMYLYGTFDQEYEPSLYRLNLAPITTNVIKMPFLSLVTNDVGFTGAGVAGKIGLGKAYFSTYQYDGVTASYDFFSFNVVPAGDGDATGGVYQTQTQLFSQKIKANEIRVYLEPIATSMDFSIALVGMDGTVISGSSKEFIVGTNMSVGDDMLSYTPSTAPTAAMGIKVTNVGSVTPIIHKIEIDYSKFGQ